MDGAVEGIGTVLHRCPTVFGEIGALSGALRLTTYRQAVLIDWALYDERRQVIADSAYFRAAEGMRMLGGQPATTLVPARAAAQLPPGRYFWIGPLHDHFGHFLVSTLSRLWALQTLDPKEFTFLYAGGKPPGELFGTEFIRACFEALGIGQDRLRQVAGPLGIPDVTVAEPSFVENYASSRPYIETLRQIRRVLAPGVEDNVTGRPVYVSKQRVARGVRTIANEDALVAILAREGVEVAYPDALPFREQIAFWCERRAVAGFSGSAFHMAGFSGGKRLCTVFGYTAASANQVAIDRLVGNEHLHLHASAFLVPLGATDAFADVLSITDPARLARELGAVLARMEGLQGQSVGAEPRSPYPLALGNEPFGSNLARGGRASQSSDYELDEGHPVAAAGAISGRLTGAYQCHTRTEHHPWWQVELPALSRVYEVRVFNRLDHPVAQARLSRFRLSASADGASWSDLHDHDGPAPGSEPFRWQAAGTTPARFVRITLLGDDFLHLDQVEVFGEFVG